MIKILFVSHYLSRNGTEAFMMNVFRNIDRSKFHVDFLIFSRKGIAYGDEIVGNGGMVYVLPERKKGLAYYWSLDEFFKKHQYDVLHWCIGSCTTIAPIFYAWKHHVPVRIAHSHSSSCVGLHNRLLHYFIKPLMNRMVTKRLACSEKAKMWLFGDRNGIIIKNGIDVKGFSFNEIVRKQVRDEFGISLRTRVIGHVGRFDSNKNHVFLVEVFAHYAEHHPDSLLMLIGTGETRTIVEEKVNDLRLTKKVLFLGERFDVSNLLQAMDAFLMPSLFEGLPFVLVEAQAAGLPCLVSDTIDQNAKITPHLAFLSLNQSAAAWAEATEILLTQHQRGVSDEYIIGNGYGIGETVRRLETIYSEE